MSRGFGSFDTTYYGPTYTEDIEAIEKGLQEGMQIGAQVAQARANSIRQKADLEAQRQRDAANQATMDKLDAATREGLVLVGDTKSDNLNDARVDFSNMLVDKFNKLKIAKDDGDITAADYSKGVMTLQAQIPAYKAAERVMRSGIEQYTDALANGNLSNADNSEDIQFWAAMTRGDANVDYRVNKDGTISLVGTWKTTDGKEKPIDAELAEMDRLPFILTKPETTAAQQLAADVNTILDTKEGNTMRQMNKDGVYEAHIEKIYTEDGGYEPWFKQFAEESFDGYFSGLGKGDPRKGLKQYLMDSIEISDRKELMDKLNGGKPSESYGLNTLNDLLANKDSTFINNFINKEVKTDWLEQTKEAVIKGNEVMLNKTNQDTTKARLELEKQKADVLKAKALASKAVQGLNDDTKPKGLNKQEQEIVNFYNNTYLKKGGIENALSNLKKDLLLDAGVTDDNEDRILLSGSAKFKKTAFNKSDINNPNLMLKRIAASYGKEVSLENILRKIQEDKEAKEQKIEDSKPFKEELDKIRNQFNYGNNSK